MSIFSILGVLSASVSRIIPWETIQLASALTGLVLQLSLSWGLKRHSSSWTAAKVLRRKTQTTALLRSPRELLLRGLCCLKVQGHANRTGRYSAWFLLLLIPSLCPPPSAATATEIKTKLFHMASDASPSLFPGSWHLPLAAVHQPFQSLTLARTPLPQDFSKQNLLLPGKLFPPFFT